MERYFKIKRHHTRKGKRDHRRSNCVNVRRYNWKENRRCIIRNIFQINSFSYRFCVVEGKNLSELDLDELDELEDSEDEAVLLEYRQKRIAELKSLAEKSKYGSVGEISAQDYVDEVNKAGEGVWVVLHLYKQG